MNGNLPVNIREFDKYLSSFGRKVFGVLLKQYEIGEFTRGENLFCKNTANSHEDSGQSRNPFVLQETDKSQTTPTDGAKNIEIPAINTNLDIRSNSSEVFNSQPVFSFNMYKKSDECLTSHTAENNEFLEPTKQVAWKDILDCQLLNIDTNSDIENTQKSIVCNNKVLEPGKTVPKKGPKYQTNSYSTDTLNGIPKKVAKITENKNNFLKRKNTKAINYWLNDVDPSHLVDGIDIHSEGAITSALNNLNDNPDDISQSSLDIIKFQDKQKKMVQTQLINDNGAMKFSKPNSNKEYDNSFDQENSTAIVKTRSKCKFVAPIK